MLINRKLIRKDIKPSLPIVSILPKGMITKPIILWLFVGFVAFCLFSPTDKQPYPIIHFLFFMLCSAIFFTVAAMINYMLKQRMIIDEKTIQFTTMFYKVTAVYHLSNITDFQWSTLPFGASTRRMNRILLKNEYIMLFFKNDKPLIIASDQFENFDLIKNHLFNYCVEAKIISIKPLEERKRSTFQKNRLRFNLGRSKKSA